MPPLRRSKTPFFRKRSTVFRGPTVASPLRSPFERWRDSTENSKGTDDDMVSILTMETIDDNIGAGRTLSKYFLRPAGLRLEKFLNRILGSALATPFEIGHQLQSRFQLNFTWGLSPSMSTDPLDVITGRLELTYCGMGTVSGLERLLHLSR